MTFTMAALAHASIIVFSQLGKNRKQTLGYTACYKDIKD